MKKVVSVLAATAFVAVMFSAVMAADNVYTYEAKNGNVTFDHDLHKKAAGSCVKCHEGAPGPIDVDKSLGHGLCKDCHKDMGGPTKCNECHKKSVVSG